MISTSLCPASDSSRRMPRDFISCSACFAAVARSCIFSLTTTTRPDGSCGVPDCCMGPCAEDGRRGRWGEYAETVVASEVVRSTGAKKSPANGGAVGVVGFERDLRKMSRNVGVVGAREAFLAVTLAAKSEEEGFECAGGRK